MSLSRSDNGGFQRNENFNKLLQYAYSTRNDNTFNDVTIIAGTERILANKMVLSCYSTFFRKMFTSDMRERHQQEVEVNGFDGLVIKQLIDFMYSNSIIINNHNVMDILAASDYLRLDDVKESCFDVLKSNLDADNCLKVILILSMYKPEAVLPEAKMNVVFMPEAYQMLCDNIERVSETENFKELSKSILVSIIQKSNKSQANEQAKFLAITSWVKCKQETRNQDFPALFNLLDVDKLPLAYLQNVLATNPLVASKLECVNILSTRIFNLMSVKILCIGGNKNGKVFEVSGLFGESNTTYPQLPINVSFHGAARINNLIYCAGGNIKGMSQTNQVFRMNLNESVLKWRQIAPLCEERSEFGCAVFDGKLVVAGGGCRNAESTELYEEEFNEWRRISSLNHGRHANALVACENCLYAIGGCNTSFVERLKNLEGNWENVKSMRPRRCSIAAVNCGECIYAIGGSVTSFISSVTQNRVQRYNSSEEKWTNMKPMNIQRSGHSACVVQDMIFVVGGINAKKEYVREIECYDPSDDTWRIVGKTEIDLFGHVLIVI